RPLGKRSAGDRVCRGSRLATWNLWRTASFTRVDIGTFSLTRKANSDWFAASCAPTLYGALASCLSVTFSTPRIEKGDAHVATGTDRSPRPWQRVWREVARLGYGAIGATHRGRGAPVDRRLLSQHRLPSEQE